MNFTKQDIIDAVKTVYDPEIPVNVWDLGLVYSIEINQDKSVKMQMTFTSPTCPMADEILAELKAAIKLVIGENNIDIDIVWTPAWNISKMSEEARLEFDLTDSGW